MRIIFARRSASARGAATFPESSRATLRRFLVATLGATACTAATLRHPHRRSRRPPEPRRPARHQRRRHDPMADGDDDHSVPLRLPRAPHSPNPQDSAATNTPRFRTSSWLLSPVRGRLPSLLPVQTSVLATPSGPFSIAGSEGRAHGAYRRSCSSFATMMISGYRRRLRTHTRTTACQSARS